MSKDVSVQSVQYDLFTNFLSNDPESVSNTVEMWESIPKYIFTPKQTEKLRTKTGHANPFSWQYLYNNSEFQVDIQPALIKGKDGEYLAHFPGITEELVEEALKKIFTYQNHGIHDTNKHESWVKFSLNMIHRELKSRGRTRSLDQIKNALQVMSKCIITLSKKEPGTKKFAQMWQGQILQEMITVGREEYLEDSSSFHIARLPTFITHSINQLEYRQFNYNRLMECDEQVARWLYKRLIHRYRQAASNNDYHFTFSSIVKDSALLQQASDRHNRDKLKDALDELVRKKIIRDYQIEVKKDGKKIVNATYTIFPTAEFIQEQKAANKRQSSSQEKLELNSSISNIGTKLLSSTE